MCRNAKSERLIKSSLNSLKWGCIHSPTITVILYRHNFLLLLVGDFVDFLNETFDFEYTLDELIDVYNSCKDDIGHAFDENFENGIMHMRKINAKLADAYKELLSLICEIIIESDGIIAESEIAEVKRLKAMCE